MKISQTEARRLRRRVAELEAMERDRRARYARSYPGGVNIASTNFGSATDFLPAVINNSRQLGHAVVCVVDGSRVLYYAIPHPEQTK